MDTQWQDDLLAMYAAGKAASSVESVFEVVVEAARAIGFSHCSYEARLPLPVAEPRFLVLDNFDVCLREEYRDSRRHINPRNADEADIFDWVVSRSDEQLVFNALTVQVHAAECGAYFTVLLGRNERVGERLRLLCLAHLAHLQIYRQVEASSRSRIAPLSRRERDVMGWAADGKTCSEIATLLGVSENTVNFHFKQVREKLGSSSKTGAVVKAALLGLLRPESVFGSQGVPVFITDGSGAGLRGTRGEVGKSSRLPRRGSEH